MRCDDILKKLEEEYPLNCAEEWDNPGLLAGRRNREVRRVFIALDATEDTIREAIDAEADLMITHHPLLFQSIREVSDDTFTGRRILALIEHEISYYAMHTNFDVLGMSHINEKQLNLQDTRVLDATRESDGIVEGIGRVGFLAEPMTLEDLAEYVRTCFGLDAVRCYGPVCKENSEDALITRVAVCGGSGKSMIGPAVEEKAQVLVTGDIDYHTAMDALAQGLCIIDAGHYGTEYVFISYMKKKLEKLFPELIVTGAKIRQPYQVLS